MSVCASYLPLLALKALAIAVSNTELLCVSETISLLLAQFINVTGLSVAVGLATAADTLCSQVCNQYRVVPLVDA